MTEVLPLVTRRTLLLLLAGAGIGLSPVGFGFDPVTGRVSLGPRMAMADEGDSEDEQETPESPEDNGGSEGGDNGGNGGGAEGGGQDGGGGESGSGHAAGDDGGTGSSGQPATPISSPGRNQLRNVTVRYSDGWVELILNDQYQLIDNLNRQVIMRPATVEDFNRMVALGS